MLRIDTKKTTHQVQPDRKATVWLTAVVLIVAFYFIEHKNAPIWRLEGLTITGEEFAARADEGDVARRLAIPALGLFGAILLVRRDGWHVVARSPLAWLLLAYVAWCAMSVAWSVNRPLTIRHVGVLLLCGIAALGIARQVTMRNLCVITLVITTIFVANSVRVELLSGAFRPLAADYRFAGTLHPNVQAPYCATMALAAGMLAHHARRGRALLWGLCFAGVMLLLLTKSRTVCAAYLAGVVVYASMGTSWPKKVIGATGIVWVALALAFGGLLLGWDIEREATNVVLLGRHEDSSSLSGRVPFWTQLASLAAERPVLGHGYHTFWNPERIGDFSNILEWTVTDGHSAYLDSLLDLGLVGAALFVAVIVLAIREGAHRFAASRDMGHAFLFVLLVSRALNGLLESALYTPTNFVSFIVVCGIAHLGLCQSTAASSYLSYPLASLGRYSHGPTHN